MAEAIKWQAIRSFDLVWKAWGDEVVVYHSGSGDAHLLSPVVAEILKYLQTGSYTIKEIENRFFALDDQPDNDLGIRAENIFMQLNNLCLIEPSPT